MDALRKIAPAVAAAALALTLGIGLIGCAPSKDNFTGVWQVSTIDGTSMDQVNNWAGSMDMTLTLNEDGSASMKTSSSSLLGGGSSDSAQTTWEPKSDTECSIKNEPAEPLTGRLDGDFLTVTIDGSVVTFKRA